jgi:hypothetical protein
MNDEVKTDCLSFIVPRFYFIVSSSLLTAAARAVIFSLPIPLTFSSSLAKLYRSTN